jgi:hypothetical protein
MVSYTLLLILPLLAMDWMGLRYDDVKDDPLVDALVMLPVFLLFGTVFLIGAGEMVWGPALLLVWLIAAVCVLPFGARLVVASAFLDISVSGSPPGKSDEEILPNVATGFGLAHSASYQDTRAIGALVEWIRSRAARVKSPSITRMAVSSTRH